MKKILLSFVVLLSAAYCSNIYSPTGVKGKDAKKEIEDLSGNLGILSISTALSSTSSFSSTFVCPTESTAIEGSANASTASNFTLPATNAYVDLNASAGGTLHFRSGATTEASSYTVRILQTASTNSTATCTYTSSGICGGAITAGTSIFSTTTISVSAAQCLAIRCTTAAYIRLQLSTNAASPTSSTSSFFSAILAPDILDSVSGIEDDKYYTKESLEKCKEGVTNIAVLQSSISSAAFSGIREVSSCNKPFAAIPPVPDSSSIAVLQGNECKLEEVNLIGF